MTEAFLHYLFDSRKLGKTFQTTEGVKLEVLEFGQLNRSSGPDFLQSQIKYDNKRWAGNIEFHLKSSDWNKHGHQNDKAYNNVIAHFVLEHDKEIFVDQFKLPVVELKNQVSEAEFKKFETLLTSSQKIPCENLIHSVSSNLIQDQINEALLHRFERKSREVLELLHEYKGDQHKVEMLLMAKILGGKHNAQGFQKLVDKVDSRMLALLNFDPFKLQALFHGLSGLLSEKSSSTYVAKLINEFDYLKSFLQLTSMSKEEWKFFGMRPAGHPTFRIAQLANYLSNEQNADKNSFWRTHYNFQTSSKNEHDLEFSNDMSHLIQVNCTLLLKYAIADLKSSELIKREVLNELTLLKAEKNKIITDWMKLGVNVENTAHSQGLIEQKNEYCNRKKCLFCSIGRTLLNQ